MADHGGHRDRLRKKFSAGVLEDHELLELLLFGVIPRMNTNAIAHDLIDRFDSLKGVLNASESALETVDGVGKNTAVFIAAMGECMRRCSKEKLINKKSFGSVSSIKKLAINLLSAASEEQVFFMGFSNSRKMIFCDRVEKGSENEATAKLRELVSKALNSQAAYVAVAHNHPNGHIMPSIADYNATQKMKNSFEAVGISFIDQFIVCGDVCRGVLTDK